MKRITSDCIESLKENEIFVFGSNLAGRHGKGAADMAYKRWGAIWRQGIGSQGNTYAIPTKDKKLSSLTLGLIKLYINDFVEFACENKDKIFLVTEIGCGLAGYNPKDIAPLFEGAKDIKNIYLPKSFWNELI